jgi:magnesium-transporting ATPase (P-type)
MTDNIVKFVIHLMSGNVAEVVVLIIGLGFLDKDGYSVYPLSPLQILWVNMVTSSPPALGLAMEDAEPTVMEKKPIGKGHVLIRKLVFLDTLVYGGMIGVFSLLNFIIVCFGYGDGTKNSSHCNGDHGSGSATPSGCDKIWRARSACFGTMTLLILIHAYNCKDLGRSLFVMKKNDNDFLKWAVLAGIVTLIPTFYIPVIAHDVFYQEAIDWEWGYIILMIFVFLLFSELYKKYIRPPFAAADEEMKKGITRERRASVDIDVGGKEIQIQTD